MWMLREPLYRSIRDRIRADEAAVRPAAAALRADAAALVHDPGPAVTDKTFTPHSPTRDPHAYVSVATYYWPNPDTPDGLPYVPRDGRLSPDVHRYDRPRWDRAAGAMVTLVKAAWFLDGADFARAAAARVRR
ncbi:MAG: alginate lyase family protein, partial [Planctomycetota bacterium]